MKKVRRTLSKEEALAKLRKYCAYQERCHQDVRYKLVEIGLRGNDLENVMGILIEESYLDEERFAISFARGKFRHNQWGKYKILQELVKRQISDYLCKKALAAIEPDVYQDTLKTLLEKKRKWLPKGLSQAETNLRLFKFVYQKGYEPELIYTLLADNDDELDFV